MGKGRHEHGIYVFSLFFQENMAIASKLRASFEIWHHRLGHSNFDIISFLNKSACLFVTSILPQPSVFSSCPISKQHRLSFDINDKRALHVLDLIYYDL